MYVLFVRNLLNMCDLMESYTLATFYTPKYAVPIIHIHPRGSQKLLFLKVSMEFNWNFPEGVGVKPNRLFTKGVLDIFGNNAITPCEFSQLLFLFCF